MTRISRRGFCAWGLAAGTALGGLRSAGAAALPELTPLGKVAPRTSKAIQASPLSVGFETLDRQLFVPERTYAHLAALGVKWARVHTGWCRTERSPGAYDFAWLDAVVDALRAIGIQPWFCVGFGNRLYTPAAPFESAVGWLPTGTAEGKAAWIAYVEALAQHYRERVGHFEVWNEPNGKSFWRPGLPNPKQYVELVATTAAAIRRRAPSATVVGGAITGMETKFFAACMESGLGAHVQKISYHSYRFLPEQNYAADVKAWRSLIAKYAPGLALWHGEVGAASQPGGAGGKANYPWTEARQAKWLLRRFVLDLAQKIELVSYYHTVDLVNYGGADGPTGKTNFKGLLRGDYTPKPAYFAYQTLCALFDARTAASDTLPPLSFEKLADVDHAEIVSAAFVRDGRPMYAYWHPPGKEMERAEATVEIFVPAEARIAAPVLVELLDGRVLQPRATRRQGGWVVAAPLADHPLLLADRAAVLETS